MLECFDRRHPGFLIALVFALSAIGCDGSPPISAEIASNDPRLADASLAAESRSWESAPLFDGMREDYAWIAYGGKAELTIHHGLGRRPQGVLVYISFDSQGRAAALAAGDLALVDAVTAESVKIRNGTNGNYYLRLVVF